MKNINDGRAAFPLPPAGTGDPRYGMAGGSAGMSLRDWFAGQSLSGMHARDTFDEGQATPQQRARLAYIDADAMIEAREGGAS